MKAWPDANLGSIERVVVAGAAALVGALAGLGAIVFWTTVGALQGVLFGATLDHLLMATADLAWWQILLVPTAGGLAIGIAVSRFVPAQCVAGVADVIESSALRGGYMPLRGGIIAALISAASIGVGASVGREGPLIHLGATFGAWIRQVLRLPDYLSRRLIGCGVAAGIAASFNAPIAGAIFAIEVVVGKYSLHTFAPIAIGSIAGTIVSRAYYGDQPAFAVSSYAMGSLTEFPLIIGLGFVAAAGAFSLLKLIELVSEAHARLAIPIIAQPAIGGLGVGVIALAVPQVLGVGYEATEVVLTQGFTVVMLTMLVFAKLAATALSLGSNFGGGIFSPSVLFGAALGALFGNVVLYLIPGLETDMGAYVLVGMGATAGAVLGAPLSTTLIVFEMTGNYSLAIAVLSAVIISSVLVNDFWGRSYFTWQLARRGINLALSQVEMLLQQSSIEALIRSGGPIVSENATLPEVRQKMNRGNHQVVFVVDGQNVYRGRITAEQVLESIAEDGNELGAVLAKDICSGGRTVNPEDSLSQVLMVTENEPAYLLPAVPIDGSNIFLGYVKPEDVLRSYHAVLDRVHGEDNPVQ